MNPRADDAPMPITGVVVDAKGTALAGVEVTARHAGDWRDRLSTRTASDGTFRFDATAIGRTTVMAFFDGYQLAVLEYRAGDGLPLEIRLEPASQRTIQFRVLGATPEQLATAECFLYCPGLELPESCVRGRLDASGVWQVRGLPNDRAYSSLQVTIPGAQCEPRLQWCAASPKSGRYEFEFTVCAIVTRSLRGRVLLADGAPLAGVTLEARSNFGGDETVTTDGEGRFVVNTRARDDEIVAFELATPGWVLDGPDLTEFVSPKARDVHRVRVPCDTEIVLTALRAASVCVVCALADGSPAASAFVFIETPWQAPVGRITSQLATGVADAQGVISFHGLHPQPGATVFARVGDDGWRARSPDVQLVAGGTVELRVVAPATGIVTGVARDANGRVLAGEPIGVYSADGEKPEWPIAAATTDRDGRFRFAALAAGTYTFGPTLAERALPWRSAPFAVTAGGTLHHDFVARAAGP